jgi:hypothetical protein
LKARGWKGLNPIMVEAKVSIYDSDSTPLVPADPLAPESDAANNANIVVEGEEIPTILTEEQERERSRIIGAGVASGVFGLLVGGPVVALLLGFGASYAAEKKEGAVGDTARAIGDLAIISKAKAREIDEKHHVVDKSKKVASEVWEKAKEADRKHKILDKTKAFLVYSWTATVDFIRRHNLIERGVNGVGKGVCWVMEKIAGGQDRPASTEAQRSGAGKK